MAFKNYKRIKELGAGGFGTVTLVEKKDTKETVVVKQIWSPAFQSTSKAKDTAQQEIELLKALCHPNIVAYKGSFQIGSLMCIEMEYCDAGDLNDFIQKQEGNLLEEGEIFDIFGQLCDSIEYIHHKRILHRDIKPQNIFLTTEHHVKLGDFGISKTLYRTTQVALSHAGTPLYSSPEVLQYKPYNNKSDMWSTGVVLYEMTMLKHPFIDQGKGLEVAIGNIINYDHHDIYSSYNEDHREMIKSMLKKEPSDRPSIHQLLQRPPLKNRLHLQSFNRKLGNTTGETFSRENVDGSFTVIQNQDNGPDFGQDGKETIYEKSEDPESKDDSGILTGETKQETEYFQDSSVPLNEFNPVSFNSQKFLFDEDGLTSAEKSLSTGHLVISIPLMVFLGYQALLVMLLSYGLES